jgi:thymidine kinase
MSNSYKARIEVILGCMFSGKSTELLRRTNRYRAIQKKIFLVSHTLDTRTGSSIQTHEHVKEMAYKTDKLLSTVSLPEFDECDVVGVDEAQFFTDLIDFVKVCERLNKVIIVAGLDGDYKRQPIGQILDVIPMCDTVVKLTALDMVDKDGSKAIFSMKLVDDDCQIEIGASDLYVAVSRKNYINFL